jgi:hypothetical protein
MDSSLTSTIVNQLIRAMIGVTTSIAVSWYFYKKADLPSRIVNQKVEDILRLIVLEKFGGNFECYKELTDAEWPKNTDVPVVSRFWYSKDQISPGENIIVVFRVADNGQNFPGPSGIEVLEETSRLRFPVSRHGYGYYSCIIEFPNNTECGIHSTQFKLTDLNGNLYTQSLQIKVKNQAQVLQKCDEASMV